MKHRDVLRKMLFYAEQVFATAVLAGINILVPMVAKPDISASILLKTSWVMLFAAIITAYCSTPILASFDKEKKEQIIYNTLFMILLLVALFLGWLCFSSASENYERVALGLMLFCAGYACLDVLRKSYMVLGFVGAALVSSLGVLLAVLHGVYSVKLTADESYMWLVMAYGVGAVLIASYAYLIFRVGVSGFSINGFLSYLSSTFKQGNNSLMSYLFAWAASQGLFIFFYDKVSAPVFEYTKWSFSIFGFVGLMLAAQENRLQPVVRAIFLSEKRDGLTEVKREVAFENKMTLFVVLGMAVIALMLRPNFGVSAFIIVSSLVCYRWVFSLSKYSIFCLRAQEKFSLITITNAVACAFAFLAAYSVSLAGFVNSIGFGFLSYAIVFYVLSKHFLIKYVEKDV